MKSLDHTNTVIVLLTVLMVLPWDMERLLLQTGRLLPVIMRSYISWPLATLRRGVILWRVLTKLELKG